MKKILLSLVLIFGYSCFSQSGMPLGGTPPGGLPSEGIPAEFKKPLSTDEMLAKMTTELKLNELQQLQVREILKTFEKENTFDPTKIKPEERPDFQTIKEKIEAKKKLLTAKLSKVLTVEQLKKFHDESDTWKPEK
ncbi:hypothetical protein [Flavobacterium sp. TBRC 19031]|uniref:hypothetical protein n=1 Tax=Flavobacterium mekongense TaxID=3379707 RepID=UPI0039997950